MPPMLQELQKQCKDAGLDPKGEIPELIQLLKDHKNREESLLEDQEDPMYDAILVTQPKVGGEGDMKDTIGHAIQEEVPEVKAVMGEIGVSNPRRSGLAGLGSRIASLEGKASLFDGEIELLKGEVKDLQVEVDELRGHVSTLKLMGMEYRRVRNRFISTFKRDKLNYATQSDHDIIREGIITVHGGDAAVDCLLYEGAGGRCDSWVFEKLYGMHPADVKKITHKETIDILNLHAGVRADNDKIGSDEFYDKFAEFIKAFKRSCLDVNYLTGEPTNVTAAYGSLLKCKIYQDSA